MAKRVPLGTDIDIGEEGECLDIAVLILRHVDIALTNRLALDTTEMVGLLLLVVLHNVDNRETVHGEQVFIQHPRQREQQGKSCTSPYPYQALVILDQ